MTPEAQAIYDRADLMIVVGSRLRGNETRNNAARLPRPLVQIDADAGQAARNYRGRSVHQRRCRRRRSTGCASDCRRGSMSTPNFSAISRRRARNPSASSRPRSGPIASSPTRCRRACARGAASVRARRHAVEQHLRQSLCAPRRAASRRACARRRDRAGRRDGGRRGARRRAGEDDRAASATAAPWSISASSRPWSMTKADIVFVLMNDRGYGVIRNIQDAQFGGRRHYADLHTPDFGLLGGGARLAHQRVSRIDEFEAALDRALSASGPQLVEVDMVAIGPFAEVLRRAAGRRGGKRMNGARMSSILEQAARSRSGAARSRICAASRSTSRSSCNGAALPNLDFSGATFNAPAHAARARCSRASPGSPAAPSMRRSTSRRAVFLSDAPVRTRALPPRRDVLRRRIPRRRLLRPRRSSATRPFSTA